jgi:hypothetical protein
MQRLLQTQWRQLTAFTYPLPPDLRDQFLAVHWRQPEAYTRPEVLAGMSTFATQKPAVVQAGIDQLSNDLDSGAWHRRFGEIQRLDSYDAGSYALRASDAIS